MAYKDPEIRKTKNREAQRRLRAARAEIEIPKPKHAKERRACERDLLLFINTFVSDLFPLPFSKAHFEIIETLQETILNGGQYALACPRSFGKSTLTRVAALWAILYGHRKSLLILRASGRDGKDAIYRIKVLLETERSKLAQAFPEVFTPFFKLEGSGRKANSQTVKGQRTKITYSSPLKNEVHATDSETNRRRMGNVGFIPRCVHEANQETDFTVLPAK